jgi:flagellar motor switch protein FliG
MTQPSTNLRKAAVFIRSLDADAAATMLAQLSANEAAAIREAIRRLGPLDAGEQADVLAELQSGRSANRPADTGGVELELSSSACEAESAVGVRNASPSASGKRFEFLDDAPVGALVTFLSREHAQTIAVVLSHLEPARAASVLALLPQSLQVDTIERLAALGQSDPESVSVLEKELAEWVAKRTSRKTHARTDKVAEILAAADGSSREKLLSNLKSRDAVFAASFAPSPIRQSQMDTAARRGSGHSHGRASVNNVAEAKPEAHKSVSAQPRSCTAVSQVHSVPAVPPIDFDHLVHLDTRTLAIVLRDVDANVLALALAGSSDELVDRICDQMPKRIARSFRRELRRLGPTRLSDVEAAQRDVAGSAARHLAARRRGQLATRT